MGSRLGLEEQSRIVDPVTVLTATNLSFITSSGLYHSPWFIANRSCNTTSLGRAGFASRKIQNNPVIFPVIGSSVLAQPIRMTQLANVLRLSKHCVLVHVQK